MTIEQFLMFLGLVLALVAAIPPLRAYPILNAAVVAIAIAGVLMTGAVKV